MPKQAYKHQNEVEEIVKDLVAQLKKTAWIWFLFGLFVGFIVADHYSTVKVKNIVYWNQKILKEVRQDIKALSKN